MMLEARCEFALIGSSTVAKLRLGAFAEYSPDMYGKSDPSNVIKGSSKLLSV